MNASVTHYQNRRGENNLDIAMCMITSKRQFCSVKSMRTLIMYTAVEGKEMHINWKKCTVYCKTKQNKTKNMLSELILELLVQLNICRAGMQVRENQSRNK